MVGKIRVLLADDHAVVRTGLRALLNAEPGMEIVGEAGNGREAIGMCEKLMPDIVLMDITMPEIDGLEATRVIQKCCPEARVLVLTIHDNEAYLFEILEAGASGYIVKTAANADLIGAIYAVSRGEAFLSPSAARMVIKQYLQQSGRIDQQGHEKLTSREKEVLRLLAEGFTNQQIADDLTISVKTVETHRAHVLEKLELRTRADLVRYARIQGLMD